MMKAILYSIWLQWKLDFRNKSMLTSYYVLPIAFFLIVGAIYKEVNPSYANSIIPSMNVLAISIAAYLGTPGPLNTFFNSESKKTYIVGNIDLKVILLSTFVSAFTHISIIGGGIIMLSPILFDAVLPVDMWMYLGWLALSITISIIIGMIIGISTKNNSSMTMVSQLAFLPTMLLAGIILPASILPNILQDFSKILPATYSIEILNSLDDVTGKMFMPLLALGTIAVISLSVLYKRRLLN